jgi:preprotein translocase subunit SecF
MGKFSVLGNQLYSGEKSIDFIGRRWTWYAISAVILLIAIGGWTIKGLNFGIEFTGGNQYTVSLPSSQVDQDTADELREAVAGTGIDDASAPIVTTQGNSAVVVQTEPLTSDESDRIVETIVDVTGVDAADDITQNEIGPSWGQEVAERSLIGLAVFLVGLVLFIWAYFREWKMAVGALVAVAHDVVITIGVYAISGFEVTPASVTGLLTILGFSLYDTVVVFDQVRNNTKNLRQSRQSYAQAANLAVNQTLVRSINTSIVALIPVGVILWVSAVQLGASSLKDLSLALFVGTAAGVYSSVFIATPLVAHLKSTESEVKLAERRAKARARAEADRYAAVPAFTEDLPVREEGADEAEELLEDDAPVSSPPPGREPRQGAQGRGRTVPQARRPVQDSPASGRNQPSRQPRSKRQK